MQIQLHNIKNTLDKPTKHATFSISLKMIMPSGGGGSDGE